MHQHEVGVVTELAAQSGETLEDGMSPSTPDGDNLVMDHARAEAAAYTSLVHSGGGRILEEPGSGLMMADLGVPTPFGNPTVLTRPVADDETSDVTDRIRHFYSDGPGGPYLVMSPWRTTDWTGAGFVRVGHPPLMYRPPTPWPETPTDLSIDRVGDGVGLDDFERTLIEAYPAPEMQPWRSGCFLGPSLVDSPWHLFVGHLGGIAVATAGAFVTPHVTMVELVSVRTEARRRGLGAAVTAAAGQAAPGRPTMLIASDDGFGVYQGLGFVPIQRYTLWLGQRAQG